MPENGRFKIQVAQQNLIGIVLGRNKPGIARSYYFIGKKEVLIVFADHTQAIQLLRLQVYKISQDKHPLMSFP
ncbi:hypothetical protein D9M69_643060 [compost metagenome]